MLPTQRLQYPLIKEYTLNYNRSLIRIKVYSLIQGYWSLWVVSGIASGQLWIEDRTGPVLQHPNLETTTQRAQYPLIKEYIP